MEEGGATTCYILTSHRKCNHLSAFANNFVFSSSLHFRFSVACIYAVVIYASVVNCSIFHSVKHLSFLSKCDSKERLLESYNVRHYSCTTFIVCIQLWASTITTQYTTTSPWVFAFNFKRGDETLLPKKLWHTLAQTVWRFAITSDGM